MALVAALALLTLDRTAAIPVSAPDAETASAARALFDRVRDARTGFVPTTASTEEVAAAGSLAGRAAGVDRVQTALKGSAIVSRASLPIWLGFWLNAEVSLAPDENGRPTISGRIGRLPVPGWLAKIGVWSLRQWLARRGQAVPPIDEMVRKIEIERGTVSAEVRIPRNGAAIAALAQNGTMPIDGTATAAAYCRLIAAQREQRIDDLARLTQVAFSQTIEAEARPTLVALAMVAVSPKVSRLAGPGVEAAAKCGSPEPGTTLHGRADLAKHWALSAAIAAAFGPDASAVAGVWKELSDSAEGGSGFSYVDLAADRAGTLIGDRASRGPATAAWLAKASEQDLLPISQLALAEGMSEAAFARLYGAIDDARHKATVRRIDSVILRNLLR